MLLSIRNLTKQFADKPALTGVNLDIYEREIVCLLGPSGCGKTTLLRIIAGLETADSGQVLLHGQDISQVPPHRRDFGLMFQDFALFPHKNVFDNVAFGLRMKSKKEWGLGKSGEPEITEHVRLMLALVGLEGFDQRSVNDLSGGEAQRVALARSLAPSPCLLMLDEPLGSLDRALRERLMNELRDILKEVGVTALYVTHDQAEAFAIGDRVVVMDAGRIEQIGPPENIYHNPATSFVAEFLGLTNLADGRIVAPGQVASAWGYLAATTNRHQPGEHVSVLIRPEAGRLYSARSAEPAPPVTINILHGELTSRSFRGGRYRVNVQPETGPALTFELTVVNSFSLSPGDPVTLTLDPAGVVVLPLRK